MCFGVLPKRIFSTAMPTEMHRSKRQRAQLLRVSFVIMQCFEQGPMFDLNFLLQRLKK
jgi:hypothetical protein